MEAAVAGLHDFTFHKAVMWCEAVSQDIALHGSNISQPALNWEKRGHAVMPSVGRTGCIRPRWRHHLTDTSAVDASRCNQYPLLSTHYFRERWDMLPGYSPISAPINGPSHLLQLLSVFPNYMNLCHWPWKYLKVPNWPWSLLPINKYMVASAVAHKDNIVPCQRMDLPLERCSLWGSWRRFGLIEGDN
jgi:hypothetical protein